MKCESCKFWEIDDERQPVGSCHRYAPRPSAIGPTERRRPLDTIWPGTKAQDWCGEWSVKVEVEAEP